MHLFVVKYLPEWLPGMSFKKLAREWRGVVESFYNTPYDFVKKQLVSYFSDVSCTS